ncbi:hypothetical protein V6O07_06320, partial [Arthrospira platensis SPKY2]
MEPIVKPRIKNVINVKYEKLLALIKQTTFTDKTNPDFVSKKIVMQISLTKRKSNLKFLILDKTENPGFTFDLFVSDRPGLYKRSQIYEICKENANKILEVLKDE